MSISDVRLNIASAEPLYRQLEELLKKEIDSGVWPSGSRLPTENDLVASHHVSRVTVRKALDALEQQGYLERRSGKGTFVAEKKIQRELPGVLSFTEMCRSAGSVPGAKIIRLSLEMPSEKDARLLKIPEDSRILILERIRTSNGVPVLIEGCKFSEDFTFLMGEDLEGRSLYETIKSRKKVVFTKSSKTLDIVYATAQEARFLGITKGYPLLRIEGVVEDSTGTFRHLSKQLCIGDKFKMTV